MSNKKTMKTPSRPKRKTSPKKLSGRPSRPVRLVAFSVTFGIIGVAMLVFALAKTPDGSRGSSGQPISQASFRERSIAYIGCSNSKHSVEGYHLISGNKGRLWEGYNTGGKSIEFWADPNDTAWERFENQITQNGQPTAVWIQICESEERPATQADVNAAFENLRDHVQTRNFYISALNSYKPATTLCSIMGPDGINDIVAMTKQAVSDGLAQRGPRLGPLTSSLINNEGGCHPNEAGREVLGNQMVEFFDAL